MLGLDQIIEKYFCKENIKHAYLLETKDKNKVIAIAKKILMEFNTEVDNLDVLLNNNSYSDLRIITPDGQWIKKEQIALLKDEFKSKSAFNNKRIYIIANAEQLNVASANTILKFLEEPEENIIALLITENKSKVLETIVSRCQYIMLDSNKEKKNEYSDDSIDLYNMLENKKQTSNFQIIKLLEKYEDRNKIKKVLMELVDIYEQIMLKEIGIEINSDNNILFENKDNTIEILKNKIDGIIKVIDSLEYNINLKLLVDKLVILMFGVD